MTPRLLTSLVALILVLSVVLVPAIAQKAKDGAAPSDDQMNRMMTMMGQMQEQMKRMHDDMAAMRAMGREHHAQMQKGCPGMMSPAQPKPGG